MDRRIVVIGLDGACPEVIKPWIDDGRLPTFRKFVDEGCFGSLESTVPTMTPPGWVSLTTGKNPGQHGIYGFSPPRGGMEGRIINSGDVEDKRIWDVLGDYGMKSCVVNVPVTYPPDEINGAMVTGFLTPHGKAFTHPAELQEELRDIGYVIDITAERGGFADAMGILFGRAGAMEALPDDHPLIDPSSPESIYAKEIRILGKHTEALSMLSRRDDWDFVMYVTRGTDAILHFYWNRMDVVLDFFRVVDEQLSIILEELDVEGRTNFLVVSDHGFASPAYSFNGGDWLYRSSPRFLRRLGVYLHFKAAKAVNRWKRAPPVQSMFVTARNRLESLLPVRLVPWIGVLVDDDSEVDGLIEGLSSVSTPDGGRAFSLVKRREEVYSGRKTDMAPDIVWVPSPKCLPTNFYKGEIISDTSYITSGAHWGSRRGLLMALGPDIREKISTDASMLDIAPTIYALLSIPIPSDLDGRMLKEVVRAETLEGLEITRGPPSIKGGITGGPGDSDESEIRSRLRALGYVE